SVARSFTEPKRPFSRWGLFSQQPFALCRCQIVPPGQEGQPSAIGVLLRARGGAQSLIGSLRRIPRSLFEELHHEALPKPLREANAGARFGEPPRSRALPGEAVMLGRSRANWRAFDVAGW